MEYSGTVYVFDFDDTLMWAPDWYDDVTLDKDGFVLDPGSSGALKASMDLLGDSGMRLKYEKVPQPDNRDVYFPVIGVGGEQISFDNLSEVYPEKKIRDAGIKGPSRYSEYAGVTDDNDYYRDPDTLGSLGIRHDIMDLYKEHGSEAVILTARRAVPGIKEGIERLLKQHAVVPKEIHVRPLKERSRVYKGRVILSIATQDSVDKVHFYDDNPNYLDGVKSAIQKYDEENQSNIMDKVILHHADPKDKPNFKLKIAYDAVEIANKLDKKGMFEQASVVDYLFKNLVKNVDDGT
jgi:hypothetical protein